MTQEEKNLETLKQDLCTKWGIKNHKSTKRVNAQLNRIAFDDEALDAEVILAARSLDELTPVAERMIDARADICRLDEAAQAAWQSTH